MADDNLESGASEASDAELLSEGAEEETKEETTEETSEEEGLDEPTSEEDETSEEEEEPEEEEEEEEEDKTEEITRPSWKTIKEKYPELTKDKDFREMFHREKAFSDLFPSVEDAREASERAQVFDFFDSSLMEGNLSNLVGAMNPQVLVTFTDNILPTLQDTDPRLFYRATKPVMIQMLSAVNNRALKTGDENLKKSAANIAKFLFGEYEIPKMEARTDPELEQERQKLKAREEQISNTQRAEFLGSSDRSIGKQLRKIVSEGLDPQKKLTEFVANSIIEKTLTETVQTLINDEQFSNKIRSMYTQAEKAGFPSDFKPRIISAYLGRAKQLALTLRAKHKSAAMGKRTTQSKTPVRIEAKGSDDKKTSQISNRKESSKKSDLDIIMEGT